MRHLSLCEPSLKGRGRLAGLVSAEPAKMQDPSNTSVMLATF